VINDCDTFASGWRLDDSWFGADVVNDWVLEVWDSEVQAL